MISLEMCKKYCNGDYTKIENFAIAVADNKKWDCHHRLETETSDGIIRPVPITQEELKALECYYNRPSSELIFLPQTKHNRLHRLGSHISEEHKKAISIKNRENAKTRCGAEMRKKLSEVAKARPTNPFKGKHHTEETRKMLSVNHKGICKNKHWFNNGIVETMDYNCPEGFIKGRLSHKRSK